MERVFSPIVWARKGPYAKLREAFAGTAVLTFGERRRVAEYTEEVKQRLEVVYGIVVDCVIPAAGRRHADFADPSPEAWGVEPDHVAVALGVDEVRPGQDSPFAPENRARRGRPSAQLHHATRLHGRHLNERPVRQLDGVPPGGVET